jgi:hypothetical protein
LSVNGTAGKSEGGLCRLSDERLKNVNGVLAAVSKP